MYFEYFGFKEAPFNITPNPRFLFYSRKHLEAFSALMYGIESRKGFIQMTGEIGAGKTTVCRAVIEKLKKSRTHSSLILNPCMSDLLLLQAITEDFGIRVKTDNKKECFDALNEFLLREFKRGFNCVLIIDESQDLEPRSLEQIRLLSNLETNSEKLLQTVLIGQPELRDMLNQPSLAQLRQRIGVRVHLTPLDRTETEQYIDHRLEVAGLDQEANHIFTSEAIDLLFEHSGGVPRMLNHLCDLALLAAYARDEKYVDRKIMEDVIMEQEGVMKP